MLRIVVEGDFNARAEEWSRRRTNQRHRALLEAFATLELEIAKRGTRPIYPQTNRCLIVDLTFVDHTVYGRKIKEYKEHAKGNSHLRQRHVPQHPGGNSG